MMVMPVKYKNISLYFFCDGHDCHFQKGRGGSKSCGKKHMATVPPLRVYFLRI